MTADAMIALAQAETLVAAAVRLLRDAHSLAGDLVTLEQVHAVEQVGQALYERRVGPADLDAVVAVKQQSKIHAIWVYRDRTGVRLKQAKDAIDSHQRTYGTPQHWRG